MFHDGLDELVEDFENILEDITLEEYLELHDLTAAEALAKLFLGGYIDEDFGKTPTSDGDE